VPHGVHNKSQHNKTKQNTTAHTVTPQNCSYFVVIQFLSLLIHKSLKAINLQRNKYYNTKRYTITRAQWSTILTEGSIEANLSDCISRYHTVLSRFARFWNSVLLRLIGFIMVVFDSCVCYWHCWFSLPVMLLVQEVNWNFTSFLFSSSFNNYILCVHIVCTLNPL